MADNAETTPKEGAAAEKGAAGKTSRRGLIASLGLAAFSLAAAVIVGVMAFPDSEGGGDDAEQHQVHKSRVILPVPQTLVNLSQSEKNELLQATISVELETDDAAETLGKFNELLPKVQDQLLKVLSSLNAGELDGGASMEFLQTRIMDRLNGELFAAGNARVTSIYFTEFVIE
ncbi:MAG: flagellar basal body-associated FliL family protein [Planctomycetes bacterium]|nr:flagellar basal body-associated FliL family protein [Planctomycetota bacterium]